MKLLVCEDDKLLLKSLMHILKTNQYVVDGVADGFDALEYAKTGEYDAMIFDIMVPGMNGVDVLRNLRDRGITTPCMFLTAKIDISDKIKALDSGADDYLPKPFDTQELLARVRAMLRRKHTYLPDIIEYKGMSLNRSTHKMIYNGSESALSSKEYQILEMMMQRPEMLISIENIMTHIWGWDTNVETGTVWVHVSNLRKKMDAIAAPVQIRFVRQVGYILEPRDDS